MHYFLFVSAMIVLVFVVVIFLTGNSINYNYSIVNNFFVVFQNH